MEENNFSLFYEGDPYAGFEDNPWNYASLYPASNFLDPANMAGSPTNWGGGLYPASGTADLESGIEGPVNMYNEPQDPAISPNGWGFLGQLATTTMNTLGQALGQRLEHEINDWRDDINPQPQPAVQPRAGNSGAIGTVAVVAAIAGAVFLISRRR